ncbi:MAG TPA: hypothetical protein VGG41_18840 [Solirubrobacteraceae bacterium]|jgi:hypothetical protein
MSDDPTRSPFSALRASVAENDGAARERARALLDERIASEVVAGAPVIPRRARLRRELRRGHWIASVAAAVLVAGGGGALAAILLQTEHTGHLPVFTPQGTLSARFHVGSRARGYCWTSSLAADAADAYRCMAGNAINDPCFAASAHARTVACFIDPWHAVTLLTLSRPLPRHGPPVRDALPWAIETSNGHRCVFLTGATAPMGGERINYGCVGGSYLIGSPDRRAPLWTIRSAARYIPDRPGHPTPIGHFPLVAIKLTVP